MNVLCPHETSLEEPKLNKSQQMPQSIILPSKYATCCDKELDSNDKHESTGKISLACKKISQHKKSKSVSESLTQIQDMNSGSSSDKLACQFNSAEIDWDCELYEVDLTWGTTLVPKLCVQDDCMNSITRWTNKKIDCRTQIRAQHNFLMGLIVNAELVAVEQRRD